MQYRKFGTKIPWKVSALGFGCMRFPTKKSLFIKKVDEKEAINILRYAIDHGVNYVDTAYRYHGGKSEIIVGKALGNGYREKVHLTTKLPIWLVKKRDDFDRFLKEQLNKLQTDYLDIYLFHALNYERFKKLKELRLIEKMEEAKESGLIRHYGFSFHDSLDVFKKIIDYHDWECCQIQYNYMDAAANVQAGTEGLKYAAARGIGVIIMEPLRGGQLVNPPPEVMEIINNAPVKRTPVDWAFQFLWDRPEISVVLSGMGSLKMVKENIESASNSGIGSLTEEERKILDKIAEVYRKKTPIPCTGCGYCMEDCPSGVNIKEVFALINEYVRTGNYKRAKSRYGKLVKSADKVNKEISNGHPILCIKCGLCTTRCPQKIEIPEMLETCRKIMEEKIPPSRFFGD